MRAAFRQPGFGLLYSGLLASMGGDSLMLLVLAVWVKDLTGSNGAAGLVLFFLAIPAFIGPVIGLYVDRLRRRVVLFWGNLASAAAVCPLLLVHDRGDVWIVYGVAFLYGTSFVVMPAALNGLLKEMLPEPQLVDANASLATSKEALRLIGPLIGTSLYAVVGGGGVAVIDGLSFVYAATVIALLKVRETAPERVEQHWRDELLAGVRHIRRDRVLLHTIVAVGISLLVVGFIESAVFSMLDEFDKPARFVGVIVSVQGIGAISGGLLSSRIVRKFGAPLAVGIGIVAFAAGLLIAAASPLLSIVFVGVVILGFGLPVFVVAITTLLQVRTPQALMGRVSTATDVLFGAPQSLSLAAGALVVTLLNYRQIYTVTAAVMLLSAGYLWATVGRLGADEIAAVPGGREPMPAAPQALSTGAGELGAGSASTRGLGAETGEDLAQVETGGLDRQGDQ
jgi:MFS family permease